MCRSPPNASHRAGGAAPSLSGAGEGRRCAGRDRLDREGAWMAEKQKEHLRGVGEKEQRQYEHIKEDAEKSGRYGKRAEEVAARTVLKHHKEEHHRTGE